MMYMYIVYRADGAVYVVLEREYVPTVIPRTQLQLLNVETFQNVRLLKLSVGGPDGRLQCPSEVVEIERDCRLRQLWPVCTRAYMLYVLQTESESVAWCEYLR